MGGYLLDSGRRLRSGQLVAAEIALAALVFGAAGGSTVLLLVLAPPAALLLAVSLLRVRGQWLHSWLALGLGYAGRRRAHRPGTGLAALLDPAGRLAAVESDTGPVGVLHDSDGLVAVLGVGDPGALLTDAAPTVPTPGQLLATGAPAADAVTVQVLLQSRPAPGTHGLPASSYRQLAGGTVPAALRVLVAVRISAAPGTTPAELTPVLLAALRRTRRRLAQDGVAARPLPPPALASVLAELAPHTPGQPVRESWTGLLLGGRAQATYQPRRWPAHAAELIPRLLAVPAGEVTVALTARRGGPARDTEAAGPGELTIRLAAPDQAALNLAERELERLFAMGGGSIGRLDGEQLAGLAATLPMARPPLADAPVEEAGFGAQLQLPPAGLMVGRNRHGQPVTVRLLRPEPTRAVLVGGGRAAATVVVRALALGTHVVVQTGRPESWDHLLRGVAGPADAVALAPPGAPFGLPPASATAPQLVVLDVGPVAADPVPAGPWRTTLLVREDVSTVDLEALARADLVLLQPLRPEEAELVGGVLGLGDGHAWLTRIREDMVGLVSRRSVRWAQLSATSIEQQVIGAVNRVLVG